MRAAGLAEWGGTARAAYHLPRVRAEAGLAGSSNCWACGAAWAGAKTDGMVAVVGEGPGEGAGL